VWKSGDFRLSAPASWNWLDLRCISKSSSLATISLRLDLALFEPSGISTEKALELLMMGGGFAMSKRLSWVIPYRRLTPIRQGIAK
jgi:hypothetical protein